MTPEQQVKEIIILMSPEDPGAQTDAVFLVSRYMAQMGAKVSDANKRIALLEAQLEARSKEKHDTINEKLEAETRLKKEKADILEQREKPVEKPGPGRGRTI